MGALLLKIATGTAATHGNIWIVLMRLTLSVNGYFVRGTRCLCLCWSLVYVTQWVLLGSGMDCLIEVVLDPGHIHYFQVPTHLIYQKCTC